jgi:hypothetical protein
MINWLLVQNYLSNLKSSIRNLNDWSEDISDSILQEKIKANIINSYEQIKKIENEMNITESNNNMEKKNPIVENAQRWLEEDEEIIKEDTTTTTKLYVDTMIKEAEEDNYENGADPSTRKMVMHEKIGKIFDSFEDFKKYCEKTWGLEGDESAWVVIDNRIIFNQLEDVNENKITINDPEYKEFKEGKINLYIADYDFNVYLIIPSKSDEEAIRKFTGIKN